MTLAQFIKDHRTEIDNLISKRMEYKPVGSHGLHASLWGRAHDRWRPRRNDDDRRQWILNDETLYNWARSEGVPI